MLSKKHRLVVEVESCVAVKKIKTRRREGVGIVIEKKYKK